MENETDWIKEHIIALQKLGKLNSRREKINKQINETKKQLKDLDLALLETK